MAYKRTGSGVLTQMGISSEERSGNTNSGVLFPKDIKRCPQVPPELYNSEEDNYLSNVGKQFCRHWRDAYGIPQFKYDYFHQRKIDTNGRRLKPIPSAPHLPEEVQSKSLKNLLKKTKEELDILDDRDKVILKTEDIKKEPEDIKDEADIKKEVDEDAEDDVKDENNQSQLSDRSDEEESDQEMDEYTDYAQNYFDNGDDDADMEDDDDDL